MFSLSDYMTKEDVEPSGCGVPATDFLGYQSMTCIVIGGSDTPKYRTSRMFVEPVVSQSLRVKV